MQTIDVAQGVWHAKSDPVATPGGTVTMACRITVGVAYAATTGLMAVTGCCTIGEGAALAICTIGVGAAVVGVVGGAPHRVRARCEADGQIVESHSWH